MTTPIVVGAGISGLSVAAWLDDSIVFEAQAKEGGWVKSISHPLGFSLDLAANGWLDNEPAVMELIQHLGIEDQVCPASPARKKRFVYHRDSMVALPDKPPKIIFSPLLSFWSKLRLLWEPFVRSKHHREDESLAQFASRRLGAGVIPSLLSPMTAGIYAANPEDISVAAAFPQLIKMEKEYGSILKALRLRPKKAAPVLTSLKKSTGTLCEEIATRLGPRLRRF